MKGAVVGLIAAAISALLYLLTQRGRVDKALRHLHQEQFGDTNSFLCEVELRAEGVWVRQMNTQLMFEWVTIDEVQETPYSVDMFTKNGGVVVRNRAFATPAEREKFVELARLSQKGSQRKTVTYVPEIII